MRVLRTTNWPIGSQTPICVLPQSAEFAFRQFAQFYLSRHNGRKISLAPFLGDADLKAIFYKEVLFLA
jgi:cullin 3